MDPSKSPNPGPGGDRILRIALALVALAAIIYLLVQRGQ